MVRSSHPQYVRWDEPTKAELPDERYGNDGRELARRPDGTWEATQGGLEVVGTGDSAARATEDMAGQIAKLKEAGEL